MSSSKASSSKSEPVRCVNPSVFRAPETCSAFVDWQKKQGPKISSTRGHVSSAEEWHRYVNMPRTGKSRRPTMNKLARRMSNLLKHEKELKPTDCGHELHPDAPRAAFCPLCRMIMSLAFLNAITKKWEKVGGSFRPPFDHVGHEYHVLQYPWYFARLQLEHLVFELEDELHLRLLTMPVSADVHAHDATTAVEIFRRDYKYAGGMNGLDEAPYREVRLGAEYPDAITPVHPPPKSKKHVSWTPDVRDLVSRNNRYYDRSSTHYVPGRYAASSAADFEDTSMMMVKESLDVLLEQTQVLLTKDVDIALPANPANPAYWPPFEGRIADHEQGIEIGKTILDWILQQEDEVADRMIRRIEKGVNGITVVVNDGREVLDVVLLEEPQNSGRKLICRASWVSVHEATH